MDQYGSRSMIVGCGMVFVSLFAQGMQLIIEEHVLKNYQLDPYRMVGVEGLFGFAYIWVIIFGMSFVLCPSE